MAGSGCVVNPIINTAQLGSHPIDNERSALLVAAPVSNGGYNLNLQNYKLYELFTAGHESTFFDTSEYINLGVAEHFGRHVKLALSRSKHATYTYNPNNMWITPLSVIVATYNTISYLYASGQISYQTYLVNLFLADQTFFECVVERFQDQGDVYANTRVNVGELTQPLNSSIFIQDPSLTEKLGRLFYF